MVSNYTFNLEALQMALDIRRQAFNLNWAKVARESNVSRSTITRIMQGKNPDVDTLIRLVMWSGVGFNHLVKIQQN